MSVRVPHPTAGSRTASAGFTRTLPSGYLVEGRIIGDRFDKLYTVALGDAVTDDEGTLVSEVRGFFAEPTARSSTHRTSTNSCGSNVDGSSPTSAAPPSRVSWRQW